MTTVLCSPRATSSARFTTFACLLAWKRCSRCLRSATDSSVSHPSTGSPSESMTLSSLSSRLFLWGGAGLYIFAKVRYRELSLMSVSTQVIWFLTGAAHVLWSPRLMHCALDTSTTSVSFQKAQRLPRLVLVPLLTFSLLGGCQSWSLRRLSVRGSSRVWRSTGCLALFVSVLTVSLALGKLSSGFYVGVGPLRGLSA